MIPGLPITGVGALFYLLLTLLIPVRELYRRARGRSTPVQVKQGFRTFARQMLMQSGVLFTFALQAVLVILIAPALASKGVNVPLSGHESEPLASRAAGLLTGGLIAAGVMLVALFVFVQGLRFFVRLKAHVEEGEELLGG
ncbi:MAG: hypothetical protein K2Q09_05825 [Phycisphaerales bacterium]|nr:hypothetical protein [Phycisphaerales bacterium]